MRINTWCKTGNILSRQLLRSGTSIGANITEGNYAQSHADFTSKMNIALKEAAETEYWLELLQESRFITNEIYSDLNGGCSEIIRMLTAIVKTANDNGHTNV